MILLTQCAACAAPLGFSSGKKCGRCSTRYCGPECQEQHWKEGGHDQLCKKIKKAGGAEQYNANKKYGEAVAVAAEACAEDTKGQTCYICTQALHWKTKEGLVRMCACRGTAGFAHVSCLAEQAKILVAEAEENNLGSDALDGKWERWHTCGLCEQSHHGVVHCALGWACWKTYLGRPEADWARVSAMRQLANGLSAADHDEDALTVEKAQLSIEQRLGAPEESLLSNLANIAVTYGDLGLHEKSLSMERDIYSGWFRLNGEEHESTLLAANNYAVSLRDLQHFDEARSLLRKTLPVARRVFGESSEFTLTMRKIYATVLYEDDSSTPDDLREVVRTLEETEQTARRVLGGAHPLTVEIGDNLRVARETLAAREGDDVSSVCDGVDAMTPGGA